MSRRRWLARVFLALSFVTLAVFSIALELYEIPFETHRNLYFAFFALAAVSLLSVLFAPFRPSR